MGPFKRQAGVSGMHPGRRLAPLSKRWNEDPLPLGAVRIDWPAEEPWLRYRPLIRPAVLECGRLPHGIGFLKRSF